MSVKIISHEIFEKSCSTVYIMIIFMVISYFNQKFFLFFEMNSNLGGFFHMNFSALQDLFYCL